MSELHNMRKFLACKKSEVEDYTRKLSLDTLNINGQESELNGTQSSSEFEQEEAAAQDTISSREFKQTEAAAQETIRARPSAGHSRRFQVRRHLRFTDDEEFAPSLGSHERVRSNLRKERKAEYQRLLEELNGTPSSSEFEQEEVGARETIQASRRTGLYELPARRRLKFSDDEEFAPSLGSYERVRENLSKERKADYQKLLEQKERKEWARTSVKKSHSLPVTTVTSAAQGQDHSSKDAQSDIKEYIAEKLLELRNDILNYPLQKKKSLPAKTTSEEQDVAYPARGAVLPEGPSHSAHVSRQQISAKGNKAFSISPVKSFAELLRPSESRFLQGNFPVEPDVPQKVGPQRKAFSGSAYVDESKLKRVKDKMAFKAQLDQQVKEKQERAHREFLAESLKQPKIGSYEEMDARQLGKRDDQKDMPESPSDCEQFTWVYRVGGGGAPVRDAKGNIVTSRKAFLVDPETTRQIQMQKEEERRKNFEYKEALRQQVEEKERRKKEQRERERLEEEREALRLARQQKAIDEDFKRDRERQLRKEEEIKLRMKLMEEYQERYKQEEMRRQQEEARIREERRKLKTAEKPPPAPHTVEERPPSPPVPAVVSDDSFEELASKPLRTIPGGPTRISDIKPENVKMYLSELRQLVAKEQAEKNRARQHQQSYEVESRRVIEDENEDSSADFWHSTPKPDADIDEKEPNI